MLWAFGFKFKSAGWLRPNKSTMEKWEIFAKKKDIKTVMAVDSLRLDREGGYEGGGTDQINYTEKKNFEIPGFVLTKPTWDWVNYSRPKRVW